MKSVGELVAFLSNREQEALERTGKQNTNGPHMTKPRCTRQSFLIVRESVTSLTNTLTEIVHSHLLDRICFESMTTLGVECYFKGMRADHDMPTVANYAYRRTPCMEDDMLRIYQKDFSYFIGPNSFYPDSNYIMSLMQLHFNYCTADALNESGIEDLSRHLRSKVVAY